MITYKGFYILWICLYLYFNDAVEGMWKEVVMALFKVLSRYFSGGTEETQKTCHDSWCHGQDSNWAPPK